MPKPKTPYKFNYKMLFRLRKERNLTQTDCAKGCYLTDRSHWSKWENGKSTLYAENIKALSDFFQVPMEEFFTTEKSKKKFPRFQAIGEISTANGNG